MDTKKTKKIVKMVLILTGAILLIIEIGSSGKNYYLQSAGIICLMVGLFLLNTTLPSKEEHKGVEHIDEEE